MGKDEVVVSQLTHMLQLVELVSKEIYLRSEAEQLLVTLQVVQHFP